MYMVLVPWDGPGGAADRSGLRRAVAQDGSR
jgi:hypothetical protein